MLKKEHGKVQKQYIILTVIITLQIVLCIFLGSRREYLFTDEVMSYGLANCESYAFLSIDRNTALADHWVDKSFFLDYMQYDTDAAFSFQAAFKNQKQDVHPPLYYCFLHIVNYFFPGAVYSVWPGLLLNMVILLFLDLVLYVIAHYVFENAGSAPFAVLPLLLWGFSAAGLSNIIFIRMYLLSTLEILLFAAIHICINKNGLNWKSLIMLLLTVCMGGLTHYYFYIFAAVFGFCICLNYFFQKRIREMFLYGFSLIFGVGLASIIFPETWLHLFGYRGAYATKNVVGYASEKFALYWEWVNKAFFGNLGCCFLILFLVIAAIKAIRTFFVQISIRRGQDRVIFVEFEKIHFDRKTFQIKVDEKMIWFFSAVAASSVYVYVAIQGSELRSLRYLYPIFPLLAVFVTGIFLKLVSFRSRLVQIISCLAVVVLCGMSVNAYGIDWMYPDYKEKHCREQIRELAGKDAFIVCRDRGWLNVYQAMDLYLELDEIKCIFPEDLEQIESILGERDSFGDVLICFPADLAFSEEEKADILERILSYSEFNSFELKYDFLTAAYLMAA